MPKQGSERGALTIHSIGLNRPPLVEKRYSRIQEVSKAIDAVFRSKNKNIKKVSLEDLKKQSDEDKEYSLSIKYLFKNQEID